MNKTEEKIYAIIAEKMGVEVSDLEPETNLINDLGADSLDSVELVMDIEQAFGIKMEENATADIKTVGDILREVEKRIK